MKTYSSNLGYIMDELNISGKQISKHLNIDDSLVSKWKNNQRPITTHTPNLSSLVNFFLEYKNGLLIIKVQNFLSKIYAEEKFKSNNDLVTILTDFLTSPYVQSNYIKVNASNDSDYPDNKFTYLNFQGNEGRRESVLFFLNQILKEKKPQEVLLLSQENMNWLTDNEEFLTIWKNKLQEILWSGHKINIIHWVDRSTKHLGEIVLQWLPLYLSGNITSCYLPKYSELNYNSTLFIIKNKLALVGMEGDEDKNRYSTLFSDYPTLNHSTWIFNTLLEKCKPLVKVFNSQKNTDLKKMLLEIEKPTNETFYIANFPGFHTMPLSLFKEILDCNQVTKRIYEKYLVLYNKMQQFNSAKIKKEVYSKDSIKKILAMDSYLYQDLIRLEGQEIRATQKQVSAHLNYLLDNAMENKNYQIGLALDNVNIDLFVSVEEYVFAWNANISPFLTLLNEPNIIEAFHYDSLCLWENIPTVNKDPHILKTKLEGMLT